MNAEGSEKNCNGERGLGKGGAELGNGWEEKRAAGKGWCKRKGTPSCFAPFNALRVNA